MKRKSLWHVSIATTPEAEDAISEMLGAVLNRAATSYLNAKTGTSTITVYCEDSPAADVRKAIVSRIAQIKSCGLKTGSGKITIRKVRHEDWAESWKRHFKPIEIGDALLVKPSWSKRKPRKNQAVVILDPGLSFGTGQHPTTTFCLREIAHHRKIGTSQSFLDIGTGSGILAIAAAKVGYSPTHAFDFDLHAVQIACRNARRNRLTGKIRFRHADVAKLPARPALKYNLICANLISNLLIAERRRIVAQLNRGGILVLAGILKSEFWEVQEAFEDLRLKLFSGKTEKEWRSGSFKLV
jgi:ribosomal protein L11 methyltransferase